MRSRLGRNPPGNALKPSEPPNYLSGAPMELKKRRGTAGGRRLPQPCLTTCPPPRGLPSLQARRTSGSCFFLRQKRRPNGG